MEDDLRGLYEVGQRLGERTLDESSPGDEVRVTVNLHGAVREVSVRPHAMRDLDLVALGELITATLQAAQRRARGAYDEAITAATPTDIAQWTVTMEWPGSR
jgi:DNA-binding protein YbaB